MPLPVLLLLPLLLPLLLQRVLLLPQLLAHTHLRVVEHDDAAHEPEHVVQAGQVLQVLTLLQAGRQQATRVA